MKNRNSNKQVKLAEVSREEMLDVVGGAETFLRGNVAQPTNGGLNPIQHNRELSLAQKSVPVLDCWHECTVYISGC